MEQEDTAKTSPKPCTEHDKQISRTKHTAYNPIEEKPLDQKTTIAGNTTCQPHVVQSGNKQVTMEQANIAKPRPMTFIKHATETALLLCTYGLQAHRRMTVRPETSRSTTTCQPHVAQNKNKNATVEKHSVIDCQVPNIPQSLCRPGACTLKNTHVLQAL